MKKALGFICLFISVGSDAQYRTEVSLGTLQSIGVNKSRLIWSPTQAVGVYANTTMRFSNAGLRGRLEVIRRLSGRMSASLLSGFNLRVNERLWDNVHTYMSVPIQGGGTYEILRKSRSVLSANGFVGINVFKIQNYLAKQQTGPIYTAGLNHLFVTRGFVKSIIMKAGYELQIDNETFFYHPNDPYNREEEFHYRVKRNQLYLAIGVGL